MPYAKQGPIRQGAWEQSEIGKILRAIGTGERIGTGLILRPLAERIDPSVREELERHGDVYAGDVLNALFPSKAEFPTPMEKGLRALGGMALGAAVDPLTYLTLGKAAGIRGLTTAGRAAMRAGKLVGPPSHQAAMGQRAALTFAGRAAVPQPVSVAAFRGAEAIQRGRLGRQALGAVGVPELGALWDRMVNSAAQKFGVNIGADAWLMKSHQELFSAITGAQKLRTDEVIDTLEPMLERLSRDYARKLNIPEHEAYMKLKATVVEAADMHPHIMLAKEAQTDKLRFETVPTRSPYERARQATIRNFGLPPSFGGPASVMDNDLMRRTREIVIERTRQAKNVLAQEEDMLGRELRMVTHPDAGYSAGIISREANKTIADNIEAVKGVIVGAGRGARPYVVKPTEQVANHIARRMRIVDPQGLERLKLQGVLEPIDMAILRKGKRKIIKVDPYKILSNEVGRPMSKQALKLANTLVDRKVLSLDAADANYAGHLVPPMSTMDKDRWIWENGWGSLIPPKTVRNFFEIDPTVIDAIRGGRADRAVLSKEWFDAVKARGTDPQQPWAARLVREIGDPDTPADWKPVRGIPELDGYKMAPDELKFMKRYYEADLNLGPGLRAFAKVLGVANRGYRAWTLAIFGPYHSKNYAGGMWNYYLGSENVPEAIANIHRSASAWKAIRGGRASARAWRLKGVKNPTTGKDWTASEIWRAAAAENSWGVGHVSADPVSIRKHIQYVKKYGIDDPERELLRGARADWKANGKVGRPYIGPPPPSIAGKIKLGFVGEHPWIERGFRFGTYVDDRIRMSHMIQKLREGYPMPDAIRSVKKYFFDYHQISPLERKWGREAFPFYTWSRKNIPFQIEMLLSRPDRMARFHGGLQTWEGAEETPPDEIFVGGWMRRNFPTRIMRNRQGKLLYFAFRSWLPLIDIADAFNMVEWAKQGLTPWIRLPMEQFANHIWYTDRQIDRMNHLLEGEQVRMGTGRGLGLELRGVPVPNRLAHVVKSFRLTNTLRQIIDNPQELDFHTRLGQLIIGRLYPLDVGRGQLELVRELEQVDRDTRNSIRSSVLRGQAGDVKRLARLGARRKKKIFKERGL